MRRTPYDWGMCIGDPKLVRNIRPFARPNNDKPNPDLLQKNPPIRCGAAYVMPPCR